MAHLYKHERSPFWWLDYTEGGKRLRCSTGVRHDGKSKPCALAKEVLHKVEERKVRLKFKLPLAVDEITLADFFREVASTETIHNSTAQRYAMCRTAFRVWAELQGINLVSAVTHSAGAKYLAESLGKRSPSTVKVEFGILANTWKRAKERNYCDFDRNPFDHSIKAETAQRLPLNRAEIDHLLRISKPEWFTRATRIGLATGARVGSVWALEWQHVSFDLNTIRFTTSKTGSYVVPLHPSLRAYLEPLRKDHGLVLEDRPKSPHDMSWRYVWLSRHNGLRVNFHRFRHTLATLLATSGVDKRHAMAITNHDSEAIHDHYTHVDAAALVPVMGKVVVGF
jgi:integrase